MQAEFTTVSRVGFNEIMHHLPDENPVTLSHDSVGFIIDGDRVLEMPTHYEELEVFAEVNDTPRGGEDVAGEFEDDALSITRVLAGNRVDFPLLRVVNDTTHHPHEEAIDVARLISEHKLSVYSTHARVRGGGEMLRIGLQPLMHVMAEGVGVSSRRATIVQDGDASPLDQGGFGDMHVVMRRPHTEIEQLLAASARGVGALALLQDAANRGFKQSQYRVPTSAEQPRVVLPIVEMPDVKFLLMAMMSAVKEKQVKLLYQRDEVETGVEGYVFSVASSENLRMSRIVSAERSFGLAAFNGYLRMGATLKDI